MKQLVTIGRRHGTNKWDVVIGPGHQSRDHRVFVKGLRRSRQHADYSEVWTVKPTRRLKLEERARQPKPEPKRAPVKTLPEKVTTATNTVKRAATAFAQRMLTAKPTPATAPATEAPKQTPIKRVSSKAKAVKGKV